MPAPSLVAAGAAPPPAAPPPPAPSPTGATDRPTTPWDQSLRDEVRRRLRVYDAAAHDVELQRALTLKASRDPHWWAQTFVWGMDPRRPDLRTHPIIMQRHHCELMDAVLSPHPIVLDASRAVGKTLMVLSSMVWEALYRPPVLFGLTSKTGAEVDHGGLWQSLFGMLRVILSHLPEWMLPEWRSVRVPHSLIEFPNGSAFVGSKATPTAFHGPRFRRIVVDEAARVARLRDVMTGVLGATDAPVLISTPRGRVGYFAAMVHGELSPVVDWDLHRQPEPGQWAHVRIHYSQDPRYDEAWRAKKQAEVGDPVIWAQQYEIDYTASVPGRIWPEYSRDLHVLTSEQLDADMQERWWPSDGIIEAWDPGLKAAVVWLQPVSDSVAYVLDYRMWLDTPLEQILDDVSRVRWHRRASVRVIDPAARQRNAVDLRSWHGEFKRAGLKLRTATTTNTRDLRETVRRALAEEGLFFAPACARRHSRDLPALTECVENYRRDLRGTDSLLDHVARAGQSEPPPLKDIHSHLADALQYACDWLWPARKAGQYARDDDGQWRDVSEARAVPLPEINAHLRNPSRRR